MDKENYIRVIKENQKLIYKVTNTYCQNPHARMDLEQEILLQLWKSFKKFDGRAKISTWIYRIALNTAISFFRSDCKHNNHNTDLDASIISLPDNEYDYETEENIATLYKFINKLNKLDKALMLLYLDDYKYKDIADILGISQSNVGTKINRIKKTLKEQFETV